MLPQIIGGIPRVPRKRRLTGALVGFSAADEIPWQLVWWCLKVLEIPTKIKQGLRRPNPPAAVPVQPHHEHL